MQSDLFKLLINRNIVSKGMEITAQYVGRGISGDLTVLSTGEFMIEAFGKHNDQLMGRNTKDGHQRIIRLDAITEIEGMDVNRFARSYGIMPDGEKENIGRKRGRKSKAERAMMENLAFDDDDFDDDFDIDEV